jgi:leucyl-tRNA synthetase
MRMWMPVDLYTGGIEHAVLHLLYSRFFIKVLRDLKLVDFGEPFIKMFNQGTIIQGKHKMSKSRGNVVAPDEYVSQSGADAVRAYLMFIGPWEQGGEWNDSGLVGVSRWLNRIWNLVNEGYVPTSQDEQEERDLERAVHKTTKQVSEDMEAFRFNTMLARLMEFTNHLARVKESGKVSAPQWNRAIERLLLLLAPSTPHLAEELWERTGHPFSIHNQRWPDWDEGLARDEEVTLVVQVNGKLRDKVAVPAGITEPEARELVLNRERVKAYLKDKEVRRLVYVPGRLINIVV